MTFRVGQKVVCVDDTRRMPGRNFSGGLKSGEIYTIRWVGEAPYEPDKIFGPAVRLQEIVRPSDPDTPEYGDYPYQASRFRPIVERKTDISVFTEVLRKATKPARVPSVAITQHHRGTENG